MPSFQNILIKLLHRHTFWNFTLKTVADLSTPDITLAQNILKTSVFSQQFISPKWMYFYEKTEWRDEKFLKFFRCNFCETSRQVLMMP